MIGQIAMKLIEACTFAAVFLACVAIYLGVAIWAGKAMKTGSGQE